MNKYHFTRASGQSIPFIALIIVVLFGMVGLAVDVGNTYAEQREVVRAANAAALAGMNVVARGGTTLSDDTVGNAIEASLNSNGIEVVTEDTGLTADNRLIKSRYLGADGNPLLICDIGDCPGGQVPTGTTFIQVELSGFTNTFFARIVERDTLPVNTQAFAAQCAPVHNVYPIGIRTEYLDDEGFVEPSDKDELDYYGKYTDENYTGWLRRIYLKDHAGTPGGFSYLRWLSATRNGSARETIPMFVGDGNLEEGFEEVTPWPISTGDFEGYPTKPGVLSPGDWVHGNTGFSNANDLRNAFQDHIDRRTVMILPIIDDETWANGGQGGNNVAFQVSGFGAFLLRDYDKQQGRPYMDMVYLGEANNVPCEIDNPPASDTYSVKGNTFVYPRDKEVSTGPVDFVILLDTSGSMNWNFIGQSGSSSRPTQCAYNPATPDIQPVPCSGAPWNTTEERRIYIAKQAIMDFIDSMSDQDAMQIIAFTSQDFQMNPVITRRLGTEKEALKQAVLDAGKQRGSNDPYRVGGGTPSPRALMRSREVLARSPGTAPNGLEYRQVVIFLTDGVANHFDDRYRVPWRNGRQWFNAAGDKPECRGNDAVGELIECQTGYVNDDPQGIRRPITSMIYHGEQLQDADVTVFAMMMGAADATGLDRVASDRSSPFYTVADQSYEVEAILDEIRVRLDQQCLPKPDGDWADTIEPQNAPATAPEFGEVIVTDDKGTKVPGKVRIMEDQTTGKLTYEIVDLVPGTYTISRAWLHYQGDDGIERVYEQMINKDDGTPLSAITFEVKPSDTLGTVVEGPPLYLDLPSNADVCAAENGTGGP